MLNRIKIGPKLIGGFLLVAIIAAVIGIIGIVNMKTIDDADTFLYEKMTVPLAKLCNANALFQRGRINIRDMIRASDANKITEYAANVDKCSDGLKALMDEYKASLVSDEDKKLYADFLEKNKAFDAYVPAFKNLAAKNSDAEAYLLLDGDAFAAAKEAQAAMDNLVALNEKAAKETSDKNTATANSGSLIMIIALLVGVLFALIIGVALTVSLTKPLGRAVVMIQELGKGHLGMRLAINSSDEIGIMAGEMDKFADDLQTIVVGTMRKIADGDVSMDIVVKDNQDEIAPALKKNIETIRTILKEFQRLTVASQNGMLSERGNPDQFKGAFMELIKGTNTMLDAILLPIGEGNRVLAQVSEGKVDEMITHTYKGDHERMKQAINNVAMVLQGLTKELGRLTVASREGQLSERGKADLFKGAYSDIILGVNSMLEAILQPINEAAGVLDTVAARDMTARVKGDYKGDHAKIKNALNMSVGNLDTALQQVAQGTEQVSSAGQQISAGSQSLAQGANEQASNLEEISSSLEEMASMTKQNAENAGQAKALAGEANNNAAQGKQAMARMSDAINKIKESSDKTAKIVKTIDEIAMQTNLLALNAAVEAARAGEAGRGFAVVAEEVRNLAQRSAQAAKNTADMIAESVKNSEEGVKISLDVAKSFEAIAIGNAKVNDLISEIAAASQEQTQGIDQVNTAVSQMDKVTQQNAANSEESASAAEELSSQAEELQNMVSQFTLSISGQQHSTAKSFVLHDAGSVHQSKLTLGHKADAQRKMDAGRSVKGVKIQARHTGKEAAPQQAIPFEGDEALKEF